MMIPVNPLSTHPDAGSGHVGGSQHAANSALANNCRKAATQSTPTTRVGISTGIVIRVGFALMTLAIIAAFIGATGGVR